MLSDDRNIDYTRALGQEALAALNRFLARRRKTRLELRVGIVQFGASGRGLEKLEERIAGEGPQEEPASRDLQLLVESALVSEFADRVNRLDPLGNLSVAAYNPEKGAWRRYDDLNEAVWLRGLEGTKRKDGSPMMGQFGHIGGDGLGRGKTAWGVKLAQIAVDRGYHVLTNIRVTGVPDEKKDRVVFVARLSDLIREAIRVKRAGGRSLAIIDESLFVWGRQDAGSRSWRDFDKFTRWVRKLRMSLVFITHHFETDVPEKAKPFFTARFDKTRLTQMVVSITSDHYKLSERVRAVPDAPWEYDEEGRGGLEADVDIQDLHNYLTAHAKEHDDEDELTLRYLDDARERGEQGERVESPLGGRVSRVLANLAAFQRPDGRLSIRALMEEFDIDRSAARYLAETVRDRLAKHDNG